MTEPYRHADHCTKFSTVIGDPSAKATLRIDVVDDDPSTGLPHGFNKGIKRLLIPGAYAPVVRRMQAVVRRDAPAVRGQDMGMFIDALGLDFQRKAVLPSDVSGDDIVMLESGKTVRRSLLREASRRLERDFAGLLPASLWETYAYPAQMRVPTERRSILEDARDLPNAWWMHDILLHAPAKVYSFMLHVQSTFSEVAGVVIDHECGCSDCIMPDDDKGPRLFVPEASRAAVAQAVFEHILAEAYLVICCGMPFAFATERALLEKASAA